MIDIRAKDVGATVAQKFNQGTHQKLGGIKLLGPFFGTFLGKQKVREKITIVLGFNRQHPTTLNKHYPFFFFLIKKRNKKNQGCEIKAKN
jgi:hypothetical protein